MHTGLIGGLVIMVPAFHAKGSEFDPRVTGLHYRPVWDGNGTKTGRVLWDWVKFRKCFKNYQWAAKFLAPYWMYTATVMLKKQSLMLCLRG